MNTINKMFDLTGQVAVVTGAGSGLGASIAEGLALSGASVAVVDINIENARQIADKIKSNGGNSLSYECDINNSEMVDNTVSEITKQLGEINILVNNAGIAQRSNAEDMTDEVWKSVLDINLTGSFYFCRAVGRKMIDEGKGGRIINMASVTGLVGVDTGTSNYSASKGGLIALTRCLAIEWAKHQILVNAIAPTHIRTPLITQLIKEKPETEEYYLNNIPLGRLGESSDVVGPTIFLASPAASFLTGHVLLVDGGHTAK